MLGQQRAGPDWKRQRQHPRAGAGPGHAAGRRSGGRRVGRAERDLRRARERRGALLGPRPILGAGPNLERQPAADADADPPCLGCCAGRRGRHARVRSERGGRGALLGQEFVGPAGPGKRLRRRGDTRRGGGVDRDRRGHRRRAHLRRHGSRHAVLGPRQRRTARRRRIPPTDPVPRPSALPRARPSSRSRRAGRIGRGGGAGAPPAQSERGATPTRAWVRRPSIAGEPRASVAWGSGTRD